MKSAKIMLLVIAVSVLLGCGGGAVKRVDVGEAIDLSGRWNDTDSKMVSETMIKDSLENPWLDRFSRTHDGKVPVVIVGTVRNRSYEHINVDTFVKDLERALINSGQVEFVASSVERGEIRDERKEQAVFSSEETAKEHGAEIGADFMLTGSINAIEDRAEGQLVMFYQVNLELIDIQTNRKVWIGDKKIKKLIERSRTRF